MKKMEHILLTEMELILGEQYGVYILYQCIAATQGKSKFTSIEAFASIQPAFSRHLGYFKEKYNVFSLLQSLNDNGLFSYFIS